MREKADPRPLRERTLELCRLVTGFAGAQSQADLLSELALRLREMDVESIVLTLNPEGTALHPLAMSVHSRRHNALASLEKLIGRTWREIEVPCRPEELPVGVRFFDNLWEEMERLPRHLSIARWAINALFPAHRAAAATLRAGETTVGVLLLISSSLSQEDCPSIEAFTNLLGALLESVRRLEAERRGTRQLALISALTEELYAALPSLERVQDSAQEVLSLDSRIEQVWVLPAGPDDLSSPLDGLPEECRSLAREARRRQTPLQAIGERLPAVGREEEESAFLAIPLLAGLEADQVVGILLAQSTSGQGFDEEDQELLRTAAAALVTAVQAIRLFEHTNGQLTQRIDELTALAEIGMTLVGRLDSSDLLGNLLEGTMAALDAERGGLFLVHEETKELEVTHALGPDRSFMEGRRFPYQENTLAGRAIAQRQIICIPDTSIPGWHRQALELWPSPDLPRTTLSVPLVRGGQTIGLMGFSDKRGAAFGQKDVELMRQLSPWATSALENAGLFIKSKAQKEALEGALARLGEALSSGYELQETLDTVLDLALTLVQAAGGVIDLLSEDKQFLRSCVSRNLTEHFLGESVPVEGTLLGLAVLTGQSISTSDIQDDDRACHPPKVSFTHTRSLAAVPLFDGEKGVFGLMTLFRDRVQPFDEREMSLLENLAGNAAIAIGRARLRESIGRQSNYLAAILNSAREIVVLSDDAGDVLYANPAAQQFMGYKEAGPGEGDIIAGLLAGKRIEPPLHTMDFLPKEELPYVHKVLERLSRMGPGANMTLEIRARDANGRLHHFIVNSSLLRPGRFLSIGHNITAKGRMESLRRELLRNLHHELRTPLASLVGFTQVLAGRPDLAPDTQSDALAAVQREGLRLKRLLEDLQFFTQLGRPVSATVPSWASLQEILPSILAEVEPTYPLIRFRFEPTEDLPPAACDPGSLARVVGHLLDNAAKFSPGGGQVIIDAARERDKVCFSVRDEGIGIEEGRLEEIFDPFHQLDDRTERAFGGVGLGLALVLRVLEKYEGTIQVQSRPGHGSTFTVRLPAATQPFGPAGRPTSEGS